MNETLDILNPLANPIFWPVLYRLVIVYVLGFALILFLHRHKTTPLWTSNLGQRYLSWLVIGPLYLLSVILGSVTGLAFLLAVLVLAVWEVAKMRKWPASYTYALYLLSVITVCVAKFEPSAFYTLPILYFIVLSAVSIKQNNAKESFEHLSASVLVSIWIIFSLSHFVLLTQLNNTLDSTKSLLILIGFSVPLSDVGAYVFGNLFHKLQWLDNYKVASNLSKRKTYIGMSGNIIGAVLGIWIMYFAIGDYMSLWHWVIVGVLMGVMGLVGDITASICKRHHNVKDSSNLIPGHGGIIDRIDSTLRVVVILYYYLTFVA
jgi:phosphatidate cytidylyltransferase